MKKKLIAIISLSLVCLTLFNAFGCKKPIKAKNLSRSVSAEEVEAVDIENEFLLAQTGFSLKLLKESIKYSKNENDLLSPLSISLALAMLTNGAVGQTKEELEGLFGGIPTDKLNAYLYSYASTLKSGEKNKLTFDNSIWLRDDEKLKVEPNFLQTNANYYKADVFKSAFDERTVKDINNWISNNTGGEINKVIKDISPYTMAYIINALFFEAEWATIYNDKQVKNGTFTTENGNEQTVKMMSSTEHQFVELKNATGFIKNYKGGNYSFVALLPNEGITSEQLINSLTAEETVNALKNVKGYTVYTKMPKFNYEYSISLVDALKSMGMQSAFDGNFADFSKFATYDENNLYVSDVLHKTFISVAEKGTKAGAVTVIGMKATSAAPTEPKYVYLDRPFVFMIIDNAHKLPVFIGRVNSFK